MSTSPVQILLLLLLLFVPSVALLSLSLSRKIHVSTAQVSRVIVQSFLNCLLISPLESVVTRNEVRGHRLWPRLPTCSSWRFVATTILAWLCPCERRGAGGRRGKWTVNGRFNSRRLEAITRQIPSSGPGSSGTSTIGQQSSVCPTVLPLSERIHSATIFFSRRIENSMMMRV